MSQRLNVAPYSSAIISMSKLQKQKQKQQQFSHSSSLKVSHGCPLDTAGKKHVTDAGNGNDKS